MKKRYASASGMMERPRSWKSKVPIRNFCLFSAKGVNISYTLFIGIQQDVEADAGQGVVSAVPTPRGWSAGQEAAGGKRR